MANSSPLSKNPNATFLDALVAALERAGSYNKNDQAAPAAVLWTDKERHWEPLLPQLRKRLPILTLGQYLPDQRQGTAYYLLCMIARTLDDRISSANVPIIYLPGVSRQEMRAVEESPNALKPLAELQYRGVFWTHKNARDWTLASFLQALDGGLSIQVAADEATRQALHRALLKLAEEPLAALRAQVPLRAAFLDGMLNPDEERSILNWLNDPEHYPARVAPQEWDAFCNLVKIKYGVDPLNDGPLTAAQHLGKQQGAWLKIWRRYAEAPHAYPNIPNLLRAARPAQPALFDLSEAWPQDNERAEEQLRHQLRELREKYIADAQTIVHQLETAHAARRNSVWAKLEQAPLANALQYIEILAVETQRALTGGDVNEIAAHYAEWGWRVDHAALAALAAVEQREDVLAVQSAVSALYRPWLENAAREFQKAVVQAYPFMPLPQIPISTVLIFCDALRYDSAMRLDTMLEARGFATQSEWRLAALPPITATSKLANSPVASEFTGAGMPKFDPARKGSPSPINANSFRSALEEQGYQVLLNDELGDPTGQAWTEYGAIDAYGHSHGIKLAYHLAGELRGLAQRIESLLARGWKQVWVITDHGWLLMPNGLPKVDLPEHLTVIRKGRCARLKEGTLTDELTMPWYWDPDARIAYAAGIACYEAGKEYEHGGLSPQECVLPLLRVMHSASAGTPNVTIESVKWKGLRCAIQLANAVPDLMVDLRTKAGDPESSLASPRSPNADGSVSLLVEDEDAEGSAAFVVVLTSRGTILAQQLTTVGA